MLFKMGRQRAFEFRTWGGKRKGAGRPAQRERPGVAHRARPLLARRFPVHVTWRMKKSVWNLRSRRCFTVLRQAFLAGSKNGFRVVHHSVQGNHLHMIVEAEDQRVLSRGMQGLGTRVARGLNRVMQRAGSVLDDRFHAHILRTPTEVRRVRNYLVNNARHHYGQTWRDEYTSEAPLVAPQTFLLRLLC
jgi:REP-associated tyrosine transposase